MFGGSHGAIQMVIGCKFDALRDSCLFSGQNLPNACWRSSAKASSRHSHARTQDHHGRISLPLQELSDENVDHSWLWHVSKYQGFVEAVRLRLGIAGPSKPTPCSLCGEALLALGHMRCVAVSPKPPAVQSCIAGCAAMQQENAQTLREVTLCASCNHGVEETCALTKAGMFCQFSVKSLWVARLLGAKAVKLVSG